MREGECSFRPLGEEEFDRIRPVWKAGFGDSDVFLDLFRDRMFRGEDVEVAVMGGEPVSMAAFLHADLCTRDGEEEPAGCFYALTTLPEHRGKGIAARLIRSAAARMRRGGIRSIAGSPDGPELYGYYARHGWQTAFSAREVDAGAEGAAARAVPVGAEEYFALREKALESRDHIRWDVRAVAFQEWICRESGGGLFGFPEIGPCCAAVEYGQDGGLLACELLAPDELLRPCAAGLLECLPDREIRLRLPAWSGAGLGGEVLPFGMLFREDGGPAPLFRRLTLERTAYLGFDFC